MQAPRLLFTSESVTEGHPDKLCDQVSDAVLDAFLAADPESRVACEAATTTGLVLVLGEITSKAPVDVRRVVRDTVSEIGYTASEFGFDGETCGVTVALNEQSADIKQGVDEALEVRALDGDYDDVEALGAGDQGMMYGFACDEDAGADAGADCAGASRRAAAGPSAQGRHAGLAAARRQVAGHRGIPPRAARARRLRGRRRAARSRHR